MKVAVAYEGWKEVSKDRYELVNKIACAGFEEVKKEESIETLIYYGEIYLKYIEQTNHDITEERLKEEIRKLDGKGAITMSILQKREEKGMQKGMRRGMQEGRKEGVQKVARNLLKEGVEIALVAKCTGFSESEVEKLKEELNN